MGFWISFKYNSFFIIKGWGNIIRILTYRTGKLGNPYFYRLVEYCLMHQLIKRTYCYYYQADAWTVQWIGV